MSVRSNGVRRRSPSRAKLRAKVFWTGRSQALRLPKEFRFVTREVLIHREGRRVVLEPYEIEREARGWPTAFWRLAGAAPEFTVGDGAPAHGRGDVLRGR